MIALVKRQVDGGGGCGETNDGLADLDVDARIDESIEDTNSRNEGSVGRAEIVETKSAGFRMKREMISRHGRIGEHQIAAGLRTNEQICGLRIDRLPFVGTARHLQTQTGDRKLFLSGGK